MNDPYEVFVRWYLRFNGYLAIENFVISEPVDFGVRQGGETDILAVRFPFSRESPGFDLENDDRLLDDEAVEEQLTDFVIAEVKSANDALNDLWRPPTDNQKLQRTAYLVRWLGLCATEDDVHSVATLLQSHRRARYRGNVVRLAYFGPKRRPDVEQLNVPQITHAEIAAFLVLRASCWVGQRLGVRSPHNQWHPLMNEIWKIADPQRGGAEKVQDILALLENEKAKCSVP